MKLSPLMIIGILGCLLSACGSASSSDSNSESGITLEGKTATEQAEAIVGAFCTHTAECGSYSMSCSSSSDEEGVSCSSSHSPVSYDECREDMLEDLQAQTQCWSEQEDQSFVSIIEECINAMVGQACVTQEEMDIYVDAMNAGEEPVSPRPQPEACAQIENLEVMESCERAQGS